MGRGSWHALLAIAAVGLLLRIWGLEFGLPNTNCRPDEGVLARKALAAAGGEFNPHFFNYPTLHVYLLAGVFGVYYCLGWLLGSFSTTREFLVQYFTDPSSIYVIGRAVTVAMGTATILLVHQVGRRLAGIRAGLASAAFVSVAFLHVRDSHYMTVDVPATFFILVSFLLICRHIEKGGMRDLLGSAAFAGFAVSTKYNLAIMAPVLLLAVILAGRNTDSATSSPRWVWRPATFASVLALAAAATTPFAVLDFPSFWRDIMFERNHFGGGHGIDLGSGWLYHATTTLPAALGWPLLVLALGGCVVLLRSRSLPGFTLVAAVLLYYSVAGGGKTVFFRYMIPILPLLCISAGASLEWLVRAVGLRAAWVAMATFAVASPPLYASIRFDMLLQEKDTRLLASEWIESHVPSGSRIAMVGSDFGFPRLHPSRQWLMDRLRDAQLRGEAGKRFEIRLQSDVIPPQPNYYVIRVGADDPIALNTIRSPTTPMQLHTEGVRWIVTQRHSLPYSQIDSSFATELAEAGRVVAHFPTAVPNDFGPRFELSDAFYLPYSGFDAVERPGPEITIHYMPP